MQTLTNETLGYLARHPESGAALAVLLNLSDDRVTFALGQQAGSGAAGARGGTVTHLLGSDTAAPAGCVGPHGWAILELEP